MPLGITRDLYCLQYPDSLAPLPLPVVPSLHSYVSEALSKDERGERMEALELYNQVLSTLSLGLGQVRNGTGPGMTELRNKLVK